MPALPLRSWSKFPPSNRADCRYRSPAGCAACPRAVGQAKKVRVPGDQDGRGSDGNCLRTFRAAAWAAKSRSAGTSQTGTTN